MTEHKLVIAEKPSVAQSIAKVLGVNNRKDGYIEGNGYLISWCVGHLVGLADAASYNEAYAKWNQKDLPILPTDWNYEISPGKQKQFKILCSLMKRPDVTEIICATDAGREGELIFRNVYHMAGCGKPFFRLWISSMEDSAIREGFAHLRPGSDYDNLYRSALARSQADWIVGINATRLYTSLSGTLLRVGRVQTPALSMLCDRAEQIEHFQKTPFWNAHLTCHTPDGTVSFHREKMFDKSEAEALVSRCQGRPVSILSVKKDQKSSAPPRLYDLTTLQREANRYFGYTAQQVLDTVQSLYEKKLCTYPRTDSQFLTEDMEGSTLSLFKTCLQVFPFASDLSFSPDIRRCINNNKVSDHHAILPTAEIARADFEKLTEKERNILWQIGMRLLCAAGEKHLYEDTLVAAQCSGEEFTAKGRRVQSAGWKQVEQQFRLSVKTYKHTRKEETEDAADLSGSDLPALREGQLFPENTTTITSHFTSPPKPYTEDTLLSAMETAGNEHFNMNTEKKGLGTPATRAGILEKLVKSGYVKRKGKNLLPTPEGMSLISIMPEELRSPLLTAEWENTLMRIEQGEITDREFLTGISDMVTSLVASHPSLTPEEQRRFASVAGKESLGSCPWCGASVYEGKTNWYCSGDGCGFRLWKSSKFLDSVKKPLTKAMAAELLSHGRVHAKGLYSNRTGKTFDADLVLDEATDRSGKRIASYRLEFPDKGKKRPSKKEKRGGESS